MDGVIWTVDAIARETLLFACVGFLIGGIDDLLVDVVYLVRRFVRRRPPLVFADLPQPAAPLPLAVFVAAWDEAQVIGAMLSTALARFDHADYRIYVGCYPNDGATIDAVAAVAERDPRVRIVIGGEDGPTTKAGCLNVLWRALLRDDAAAGRRTSAVVIHDAEDVVHARELRLFDALLRTHAVVQIPVMPLIDPQATLVSGHYADEFAEAHLRVLPTRVALGAAMPLAGVGCAIRRDALEAVAAGYGAPFDPASLTEDYELGLRIGALGFPACFARHRETPHGPPIAVRAYFPSSVAAAVRQKARWMIGIALAGWDRVGWARPLALREHWMRMRDRRAPLAVLVLAAAYLALLAWAAAFALHAAAGTPRPGMTPLLATLLIANAAMLAWRTAMRFACTARLYGWREGLWSIPRLLVANYIALLSVRRAVDQYVATLRGGALRWDKTAHRFPLEPDRPLV